MKIHGKRIDYYDNADTWNSDVHWARPKNELVTIQKRWYNWAWNLFSNLELDSDTDSLFLVGFCGELHLGVNTYHSGDGVYTSPSEEIRYLDVDVKRILELNIDTDKLFKETPYFSVRHHTFGESIIEMCPNLRDIEFFKVKDTYTAHQQIEQYLTNELANQLDGTDLKETEQQILERHGMNKCSFKGKHTGRKLKRK